jgi:hypothetical protein
LLWGLICEYRLGPKKMSEMDEYNNEFLGDDYDDYYDDYYDEYDDE